MATPLIVEDGTGKADADSYVSIATFKTYSDKVGFDYNGFNDDDVIAQAIRRATSYLDNYYGDRFSGYPVNKRDQSLAWPRSGVIDRSGICVSSTSVPREVVTAVCELAQRELISPNILTPDAATQNEKSITVGPVSVTYDGADTGPIVTISDSLLANLLGPSNVRFLLRG